jgi:hypothetical protein
MLISCPGRGFRQTNREPVTPATKSVSATIPSSKATDHDVAQPSRGFSLLLQSSLAA